MTDEFESAFRAPVEMRLIEKRTRTLEEFVRSLGLPKLVSVECVPQPWAEPKLCFPNVESQVRRLGGSLITGWIFNEYRDRSIEGEAHAVWLSPTGRRRDITPHRFQPDRVLFAEDASVQAKRGYTYPPKLILSSDPVVRKIEEYASAIHRLVAEAYVGMGQVMEIRSADAKRIAEEMSIPPGAAKHIFEGILSKNPRVK